VPDGTGPEKSQPPGDPEQGANIMELKVLRRTVRARASIRVENRVEKKTGCHVTTVRIDDEVEVGTRDGCLCFWVAGREVRIGPFSPDQAEKLVEDLEYEAVR
jgi:hypothetical protein